MPRDPEKTRRGIRPKDLLPRWYMNIDASIKPLIGAVAVLIVVIPAMIYAWRQVGIMESSREELNALLDSGSGTKAQLNALAEELRDATTKTYLTFFLSVMYGMVAAVLNAWLTPGLTADWLRQLTSATQMAADGDLSHDIRRDNESQIGDIQEALGKMIASFRATIHRIEASADELREAADEMAHTSTRPDTRSARSHRRSARSARAPPTRSTWSPAPATSSQRSRPRSAARPSTPTRPSARAPTPNI